MKKITDVFRETLNQFLELPNVLAMQVVKSLLLCVVAIVAAVVMSVTIGSFKTAVMVIAVPVAMIVIILYSMYSWIHGGYVEIHGTVIDIDYSSDTGTIRRSISQMKGIYFRASNGSICHLNIFKRSKLFAVGSPITVYVGAKVTLRETDYGYSIPSYIAVTRDLSAIKEGQ